MATQKHQTDKPCIPAGEILGYAAYKRIEEDGPVAYELFGKRGAHYWLMRQRRGDTSIMNVVNPKNLASEPRPQGYGFFSDRTGELKPINVF